MKRLLLIGGLILTSSSVFSQIEKARYTSYNQENKSHNASFPEIENFKGDFQLQMVGYEKIALTDSFFEYVESNRKDHERVELSVSGGSRLVIASRDELNSDGKGPFIEPFIIKE